MNNKWTVMLTALAEEMLMDIEDRRIRRLIKSRAMNLDTNPDQQEKPLGGDLLGLRSIRAVGQRYRIIYELIPENREVWIIAIGHRKAGDRNDIYNTLKRLR